jgi:hypothetical protein
MEPVFEWNPKKASTNAKKHGVFFEEARTAFYDPLGRVIDDPEHSESEERAILIAYSARSRLLFVAFTDRGDNKLRILSARRATKRERQKHEKAIIH